ncbi:MAG: glycosyltransferase family 39 protein [Planctomycetes bacterium]|nr:glycosyltransferase family 39 protein [Planctomycetota bacterium]
MNDRDVLSPPARPEWLSDCWRIGFILLLTVATRAWIMQHTEVLSRDSISFIRMALQLEDPPNDPLQPDRKLSRHEVIRGTYQPPGYPAAILAVSWPVRSFMGGTTCDSMVMSAQLTSVLASLLLVLPLYFLGKMVFDRQTAFVGTLIFQMLPVCMQVTSDGLSDGLFLLTSVTAIWFAAIAFRRKSLGWLFTAGLACGLAYLVRPEGLIVFMASGMVILAGKFREGARSRTILKQGGVLTAGLLIVMVPYVITIGKITNKPTGNSLLRWLEGGELKPTWIKTMDVPPPAEGVDLPLAAWYQDAASGKRPGAAWACKSLSLEFLKTSLYVTPFLAAIGLSLLWSRLRGDAAFQLLLAVGLCQALLLWFIAFGAGYVAERHLLLVTLCSIHLAAAAIPLIAEKMVQWHLPRRIASEQTWAIFIAVAFVTVCIPWGLKPLHANRAGHQAAGRWLATHEQPGDLLIDPFAWSEFYAGYMRECPRTLPVQKSVLSVLTTGENTHPRLHMMIIARQFAERGKIIYHWPENKPVEQAKVVIYRWEGDDFNAQYTEAHKKLPNSFQPK